MPATRSTTRKVPTVPPPILPRSACARWLTAATEQLKHVADNADEIAAKAAEQARVYGEKAQELAKNFKPYVEKSMKEQPMATLAVAAAIAFALGALWRK